MPPAGSSSAGDDSARLAEASAPAARVAGPRTPLSLLCPWLYQPSHSAIVAELSAELGSLDRAYKRLDRDREQARATRKAAAEAHRREVAAAFTAAARMAASDEAFRRWLAWPLEIPQWALRGQAEGWPEPTDDPQAFDQTAA